MPRIRTTQRGSTPPENLESPRKGHRRLPQPRHRKPTAPVAQHPYMTRSQARASTSRSTTGTTMASVSSSQAPLCAVHFPGAHVTVAFLDGDYDATAIVPQIEIDSSPSTSQSTQSEEVTHVIRISHLSSRIPRQCFQRKYPQKIRHAYRNGLAWADYDLDKRVAVLDLVIPKTTPSMSNTTRLTKSQLKLANDFLDLVFLWPTDPIGYPSYLKPRKPNPFHILVTAPPPTSQHRQSKSCSDITDDPLSQVSRDILALIGDRIDSHSDIKARDGLLFFEETLQEHRSAI